MAGRKKESLESHLIAIFQGQELAVAEAALRTAEALVKFRRPTLPAPRTRKTKVLEMPVEKES